MNDKPKLLYLLITMWIMFGLIFIYLGYASLTVVLYILGTSEQSGWEPIVFFGTFMATITMMVFGSIFLIFSYGTYKGKSWIWNAGIIISTIFIVIFSFMLASLMITVLLFTTSDLVLILVVSMIAFLVDLGIIFLVTRPNIKAYFKA